MKKSFVYKLQRNKKKCENTVTKVAAVAKIPPPPSNKFLFGSNHFSFGYGFHMAREVCKGFLFDLYSKMCIVIVWKKHCIEPKDTVRFAKP